MTKESSYNKYDYICAHFTKDPMVRTQIECFWLALEDMLASFHHACLNIVNDFLSLITDDNIDKP